MTERWKEDNRRRGDEGRYRGQGEMGQAEMGQAEDRYGHDYQSSGAEGRDAHEEERRYGRSERPSRAQERSGRYEGGAGGSDDRYYGRGEGANPQAGYRRQAGARGGFAGPGMESGEEDTGGRGYGPGGYDQGGYGQGGKGRGSYDQGGMGQGRMGQGWSGQEGQRGHAGRGPKGYTRSDDRIREDLNEQLTQDWHLDASEIEVEVANCEITLSGMVGSRDEKRRAEDIAEGVSGVKHVQNNLRVQHSSGQQSSGQQGSGQSLGSGDPAGSGGSGKTARGGGL